MTGRGQRLEVRFPKSFTHIRDNRIDGSRTARVSNATCALHNTNFDIPRYHILASTYAEVGERLPMVSAELLDEVFFLAIVPRSSIIRSGFKLP